MIPPILVPATARMRKPALSRAYKTPIWASPRAPPPPSARQISMIVPFDCYRLTLAGGSALRRGSFSSRCEVAGIAWLSLLRDLCGQRLFDQTFNQERGISQWVLGMRQNVLGGDARRQSFGARAQGFFDLGERGDPTQQTVGAVGPVLAANGLTVGPDGMTRGAAGTDSRPAFIPLRARQSGRAHLRLNLAAQHFPIHKTMLPHGSLRPGSHFTPSARASIVKNRECLKLYGPAKNGEHELENARNG